MAKLFECITAVTQTLGRRQIRVEGTDIILLDETQGLLKIINGAVKIVSASGQRACFAVRSQTRKCLIN